jgi:membrane-associated phospholipid phosphatase
VTAAAETIRGILWGPEPILAIQHAFGPGWHWFWQIFILLASAPGIVLTVAATLWLGGRSRAYAVLGLTLASLLVCASFWLWLPVPRPHDPRIVVDHSLPTASFPSGHVATMMTLAVPLVMFRWLPITLAAGLIALVMLSRLYLGVHYLGDVLGGLLVGLAVLIALPRLWPSLAERASRPPWWLVMAGSLLVLGGATAALFFFPTHRWEEIGMVAGAAVALPLEYRHVRFTPAPGGRAWPALKLAAGLGGALVLLGVGRLLGGFVPLLLPLLAAVAALWALLLAPAVFARLVGPTCSPGHEPVPVARRPGRPGRTLQAQVNLREGGTPAPHTDRPE